MRSLVFAAIAIATLGTLAAMALVMGWGAGSRPVRAVLVYAFDAPPGDEAALKGQLVEALQSRAGRDGKIRPAVGNRIEVDVYGDDVGSVSRIGRRLTRPGTLEFRILANRRDVEAALLDQALAKFPETGTESLEWASVQDAKELGSQGDVVFDPEEKFALTEVPDEKSRVTGALLRRVSATKDENGTPALSFDLSSDGAARMTALTRKHQPEGDGFRRRLAILFDGRITSAPFLRAEIGGSGLIAGKFTQKEIDELVLVLRAGALPTPIRQVVSPE